MRLAILALLLLASTASAASSKPVYTCSVVVDPAASTATVLALHVTGTVPNNSDPYLSIDGSQEWTGLHNKKGVIDDWTGRTMAELPAGTTHTAQILDMPRGGLGNGPATVISTCSFTT